MRSVKLFFSVNRRHLRYSSFTRPVSSERTLIFSLLCIQRLQPSSCYVGSWRYVTFEHSERVKQTQALLVLQEYRSCCPEFGPREAHNLRKHTTLHFIIGTVLAQFSFTIRALVSLLRKGASLKQSRKDVVTAQIIQEHQRGCISITASLPLNQLS